MLGKNTSIQTLLQRLYLGSTEQNNKTAHHKKRRSQNMKNQSMKIFTVYLEDGENCYKLTIPAFTKEQAIQYTAGNGEVIAIKENKKENDDLVDIDCNHLALTLRNKGWGQMEIDVITRTLFTVGLERN